MEIDVLTYLVQVVVLADEHLKLALNVKNLLGRKLELDETLALAIGTTGGTTDTVNVVSGVIRRVELDDPVNGRNIETTSSNVCADQGSSLRVAEFKECIGALLLLLLAVEVEHRQVDVVEELRVVLHTVTTAEEDNDLLLRVLLEEGEEEPESGV